MSADYEFSPPVLERMIWLLVVARNTWAAINSSWSLRGSWLVLAKYVAGR